MAKAALTGNAALIIWGDIKSSDVEEAALNEWWTNEHLPERMSIPGFLRARRYFSRDDSADQTSYLTLYETADLTTLTSPAYMEKLNKPTERTKRHIPTLATMKRAACQVTHSQKRPEFCTNFNVSGATMWMVEIILSDAKDAAHLLHLVKQRTPQWLEVDTTLMSCSLLKEDIEATAPGSSSQSYLNSNLQPNPSAMGRRCVLFLEFSRSAQLQSSNGLEVTEQVIFALQSHTGIELRMSRVYSFIGSVSL